MSQLTYSDFVKLLESTDNNYAVEFDEPIKHDVKKPISFGEHIRVTKFRTTKNPTVINKLYEKQNT